MNSRQKGARGERMWRDELREAGFTARRGQQFAGGTDSPDVICEELNNLHMEVKFVQSLPKLHNLIYNKYFVDEFYFAKVINPID